MPGTARSIGNNFFVNKFSVSASDKKFEDENE